MKHVLLRQRRGPALRPRTETGGVIALLHALSHVVAAIALRPAFRIPFAENRGKQKVTKTTKKGAYWSIAHLLETLGLLSSFSLLPSVRNSLVRIIREPSYRRRICNAVERRAQRFPSLHSSLLCVGHQKPGRALFFIPCPVHSVSGSIPNIGTSGNENSRPVFRLPFFADNPVE